jgi:hypothetical protein
MQEHRGAMKLDHERLDVYNAATESAAVLDVARVLEFPVGEEVGIGDALDSARNKIVSIVSMLVRMAQRVEERCGQGHGAGMDRGRGKGTHGPLFASPIRYHRQANFVVRDAAPPRGTVKTGQSGTPEKRPVVSG